MSLVKVACKFSGAGAGGARVRIALDMDRDGRMESNEEVNLSHDDTGDWSGQIETPSHTINMLILVVYEMSVGTSLEVEATNATTGGSLWKRKVTAVTASRGWATGHLAG